MRKLGSIPGTTIGRKIGSPFKEGGVKMARKNRAKNVKRLGLNNAKSPLSHRLGKSIYG